MGIRAIYFADGQFCNESSWGVGPSVLGKDIVTTLMDGCETTDFGVKANYLVEMLRIVGRTGEFYDRTDWRSGDHEFDDNQPTLGDNWAQGRRFRRDARRLQHLAEDIRDSEVAWHVSPRLFEAADELREAAKLYDTTGPNVKPFRFGVTVPLVKRSDFRVGDEAIWFDSKANVFNFGGYQVGLAKLGRLIAATLMRGEEKVSVGEFDVTVNYLVQMCRLCGRYGRFVDYNDDLFDGNTPAFGQWEYFDVD